MTRATAQWQHFDHGADIGVRGVGATLAEAFSQAALAMTAVVCDPTTVRSQESISIECEGKDAELLFVDWLNCLVYEMATRNMLFSDFDVQIEDGKLIARVSGEPVDIQRHQPAVEVKGATMTALRVAQNEDGTWIAETVVDV